MKIVKVTYQKSYIIGPYLQEKVGFEADISEPEPNPEGGFYIYSPEGALTRLKEMADEWHKKHNLHLYEERQLPETHPASLYEKSSPMPIIDRSVVEQVEMGIDNAVDIEQLAMWKNLASEHGLVSQYMGRLKILTNGNKD